jgi:branched-chain amino acid transport system permease protein
MTLLLEQLLNGLQYGVTLFLMAAGLTLVFGIMGLINLAHGSLYMIGAFAAAVVSAQTGSFVLGLLAGLVASALAGLVMQRLVLRHLHDRPHLDQVLATFGLIMICNEGTAILFGRQPLQAMLPQAFSGTIAVLGVPYPSYRLLLIAAGLAAALGLYLLISRTRTGMRLRAGATDRAMAGALGVRIGRLDAAVFVLGALLAGLAGALVGPLLSVEIGMGERILIVTFVVIVIGGVGSVRGALAGALLVGVTDTLARAYLPDVLGLVMSDSNADSLGGGIASMAVFLLMAVVLLWRPRGLFPAHG